MKSKIFVVLLAIALSSCATSIGKIVTHPAKYHNKTVKVKGTVASSINVGPIKSYTLVDKTGKIRVLCKDVVPHKGSKKKLKGNVEQKFKLGNQQIIIIRDTGK